jgi:ParB/RepB/Spo0J family partition protein
MDVLKVDPGRCCIWEFNGRLEEYLTDESCENEILSIQAHGQMIPAIARTTKPGARHDFEIICGARRMYAARRLGVDLRLDLRDLTDRQAIILMDVENRQRKDWSAYERGRSFAKWLASGQFSSQEDLAESLRISASQVSRLLKVGKLPTVVIEAFAEPSDICEMWGLTLHTLCDNPRDRARVVARARVLRIHARNMEPKEIYDNLRLLGTVQSARKRHREEVVLGPKGQALFRIKHLPTKVNLLIGKQLLSPHSLFRIKEALSSILHESTTHDIEKLGMPAPPVHAEQNSADSVGAIADRSPS